MNIPDKAMDAAFHAVSRGVEFHMDDRMYWEQAAKDMLEAAAPFIAAQALRDEAGRTHTPEHPAFYGHDSYVRGHLLARANELDPQ